MTPIKIANLAGKSRLQRTQWIGAALATCVVALFTVSNAHAQMPEDFTDSYRRFTPIPVDKLTPAQKKYLDVRKEKKLPQTREDGYPLDPYEVIMLRNPGTGDVLMQWMMHFRNKDYLSDKLQEMAILCSGAHWQSQSVWWGHAEPALKAGLSHAALDAIAKGKRQPGMAPDELAMFNYFDELYSKHAVSDATFKAAVDQVGEPGVLAAIGIAGFYDYLSMFINTAEIYVPQKFKEKAAVPYPQAH